MNYSKMIQSFSHLAEIQKLKMPYEKAKQIYDLYKIFELNLTFVKQEESKLVNLYARKNEQGEIEISSAGTITFESIESKTEYLNEINKLLETELTVEIPQIVITADDVGVQKLSPETIEKLKDVILFD